MAEQENDDLEMDRWVTEQEIQHQRERVRKLVKEWDEHWKTHHERHEDQVAFEAFQQWRDEDR